MKQTILFYSLLLLCTFNSPVFGQISAGLIVASVEIFPLSTEQSIDPIVRRDIGQRIISDQQYDLLALQENIQYQLQEYSLKTDDNQPESSPPQQVAASIFFDQVKFKMMRSGTVSVRMKARSIASLQLARWPF